jgi:hypothetical protein
MVGSYATMALHDVASMRIWRRTPSTTDVERSKTLILACWSDQFLCNCRKTFKRAVGATLPHVPKLALLPLKI